MINVENISFSYEKGKEIITNFSYIFEKEKSYVICGDNGTGKTTLLKLLLGLLKPDSGSIRMKEEYTIGYVPDYNGLYENLTLMENVLFRLGIYNKNYDDVKDKFEQWTEAYGIKEYQNCYVKNLSLGTKKKVALLCTLLTMPQILILDEPTGGLDVASKEELINILAQLRKDMLIISVTHDEYYINYFQSIVVRM